MENVTPVTDWLQTEDVVLRTSGKTVRLTRPDPIALITEGQDVPDLLTSVVMDGINGKQAEFGINTVEQLRAVTNAINFVCKAAFVYPRLDPSLQKPEGDCIPARLVPFQDRMQVFIWALGLEYQAAESFRETPSENVESVPGLQDVRGQSESTDGDQPDQSVADLAI